MSERLTYLPALDGLRAIAVTSVLLYHLDIDWATGGFLGVDLFFVISGFLITTLLLREHRATGRIGLGTFWVRRFKRLVPPLVVMAAATIAATRVWGLPEQWSSVRWDAAAALGYVANWRFVFADQSYFETLLGPSPLRHTWSLAVEEQWYLLWPIAMVGLAALAVRGRHGRSWALAIVLAASAASAIWMAVLYVADDPSRVYYGTDTRAQQLLIGAALGWLVQLRPSLTTFAEHTRGAVAIMVALGVYLGVAALTPDDAAWLYHGGFLAISLLCAALVLGTATAHVAAPLRWLTWGPLLWVGLRSYSIYLWHWPVIVFLGEPMGLDLAPVPLMILQVTVTLALADATHRLVERPTRNTSWRPSAVVASWTAAAGVAIVACFVMLQPQATQFSTATVFRPAALGSAIAGDGPTEPTRVAELQGSEGGADTGDTDVTADVDVTGDAGQPATAAEPPARPNVLILGDSTAAALWDRMSPSWSDEWYVQLMARLGCGIFDGVTLDSDSDRANANPEACSNWRNEWAFSMYAVDPDVTVVMIGAWEVLDQRLGDTDYRFPSAEWRELVAGYVDDAIGIAASTGGPVVVTSVPCMEPSGDEGTTARTDPARIGALNEMITTSAATRPTVTIADLGSVLCPGGEPLETIDGDRVRYDGVHLSERGTDLVWAWLFPQLRTRLD